MENKLEKLNQLRKQKTDIEAQIEALVSELSSIIKPRKRQPKADKTERLPTAKI